MNPANVSPQPFRRVLRGGIALIRSLVVIAIIGILAAIVWPITPASNKRHLDGTKLRTIGQAMLAADNDLPDGLFSANLPDVYAVAAQIARAGLNDPKLWLSKEDAANPFPADPPNSILDPDSASDGTKPINPKFQGMPLAFAVALFPAGTNLAKLPATTPLGWTRGLQPDGKWSKTLAPYGDWGGFVVFVGGNLERYQTIGGNLVKFGTTQPTSDIREALPPGTRIGDSTPKR